ncbi:tRNA modification GTPase MnmE [Deltaproteobacteria bacterium]|nr:tRNA modification GTPase MnmE [Deltaproteobacteria bacterium]
MFTEAYPLADTIVAIATPHGYGGIGIVRLSGTDAIFIARNLLADSPDSLPVLKPRFFRHGWVHCLSEDGSREAIDEVLAVAMPGKATFTGEDVAEIHCHGTPAVLMAVVASACRLGARLASKGEFTYRAFAHGKYDLTQAEAVAEMIAAPALTGARLAQAKLSGLLGKRIGELYSVIERLRARVALAIDFPEEETAAVGIDDFREDLDLARSGIRELLASYKRARHWREGVAVILAGKVNAGKSSLLNTLLGRNRAIVSAHPGTTRDFLEECLDMDGLAVRIIDTAGLRTSEDPIEQEGVLRSKALAEEAHLVLLVTDASRPPDEEEKAFFEAHKGRILLVRNKIDLLPEDARKKLQADDGFPGAPSCAVSATEGCGLEELAATLRRMVMVCNDFTPDEPERGDIVPNLRQSALLAAALAETEALSRDIADNIACDLFSVRLDAIAAHLAEITGFAATDDILGHIFSRFCVGK